MTGLLLCDDLIDASRVEASARAAGGRVVTVRSSAALAEAAQRWRPAVILLDLQTAGADVADLLAGLPDTPRPRVVGYGPHVAVTLLKAARTAGCDPVLPRSQFFGELDRHLAEWLGPDPV